MRRGLSWILVVISSVILALAIWVLFSPNPGPRAPRRIPTSIPERLVWAYPWSAKYVYLRTGGEILLTSRMVKEGTEEPSQKGCPNKIFFGVEAAQIVDGTCRVGGLWRIQATEIDQIFPAKWGEPGNQ